MDDVDRPVDDDEDDVTSIMSLEQRKALTNVAKTENESATLERDTAKPPPWDEHPVTTIPRAAPVPAEARVSEEPLGEAPPQPEPAAQAEARSAESASGWATWELLAFVLLAAAIVAALRGE